MNASRAAPCDVWCETTPDGRVQSARFFDPARDGRQYIGMPLRALLEDIGAAGGERAIESVLEGATAIVLPLAGGAFRIVSSARAAAGKAWQVVVRWIDADLLDEMVQVKMACVARSAGLSGREQHVLTLLMRGRGAEDIASALDIAPRTVKFHQANVLRKLGADSRIDLLRVVL